MLFYSNVDEITMPGDSLVVSIELAGNSDVLGQYSERLNIPRAIEQSVDSLIDCLEDLSWLKESTIVIIHDLVRSVEASNLTTYLKLVVEVERNWLSYNSKYFEVKDEIYNQYRTRLPWLSEDDIRNNIKPRDVLFYFREEDKCLIEAIIGQSVVVDANRQ